MEERIQQHFMGAMIHLMVAAMAYLYMSLPRRNELEFRFLGYKLPLLLITNMPPLSCSQLATVVFSCLMRASFMCTNGCIDPSGLNGRLGDGYMGNWLEPLD